MIVEVAYALPTEQKIISLEVAEDCSVYDAVIQSGIVAFFPQIDPDNDPMGIFAKAIKNPKETILQEGQRVEIYRPLTADPKEVRARRAAKMKAKKAAEDAARKQ
ncbi:MAG: RnfH family protein [Neptuniibacter caesariensis]|uniref:UPF0125 protein CSA61_00845 n=1 Tax=Neptuniibacter caesariensis TaxID=207954 RepID=A0A2G6JE26_NEPCE|nr:MAG: RnfH family protein [Neptuniibacter caesariensis]